MSDAIHQEVAMPASPRQVYQALTQSEKFGAFTGAPAQIAAEAGGTFTAFGGMISGRNIELIPDRRVVQAWRAGNWDEGVYSIVRFELMDDGGKTKLVFDQSGFPPAAAEHLTGGWHKMYWEPLRAYLAR